MSNDSQTIKKELLKEKCKIFLAIPNVRTTEQKAYVTDYNCNGFEATSEKTITTRTSYLSDSAIWISAPSEKMAREIIEAYELHELNDSSPSNDIIDVTEKFSSFQYYIEEQQFPDWAEYFTDMAEIGRIMWNCSSDKNMMAMILPLNSSLHLQIIEAPFNDFCFNSILKEIVQDYADNIHACLIDSIVKHRLSVYQYRPPNNRQAARSEADHEEENLPF